MSNRPPGKEPKITVRIQNVTPEDAESWLGKNVHNRNINERVVDMYAKDITDGKWRLTGEPIQFDDAGNLLNGQHRLLAIIKANKGIQTAVVRGLPAEAQESMDSGRKRSVGDVLVLRGIPSAHHVAAALRSLWRYRLDGNFHTAGIKVPASNMELLALWEKTPRIADSVDAIHAHRGNGPLKFSAGQVALHYEVARIHGWETAEDFFEKLSDVGYGGPKSDPIIALRKRMLEQDPQNPSKYGSRMRMDVQLKMALYIKAINAYLLGQPLSPNGLRWRAGGPQSEEFPKLLKKSEVQ